MNVLADVNQLSVIQSAKIVWTDTGNGKGTTGSYLVRYLVPVQYDTSIRYRPYVLVPTYVPGTGTGTVRHELPTGRVPVPGR